MSFVTNSEAVDIRIAGRELDPDLRAALSDSHGTVAEVGPTGVPSVEPLVSVTDSAQTAVFSRCSTESANTVSQALTDGVETAFEAADTVVQHDTEQIPTPPVSGLDAGDRTVLALVGWVRPTEPDDYEAAVGFDDSPRDRIDELGSDIRGRGWGDWCQDSPLRSSWQTARQGNGTPTVVVNAHGNRADTLLLSSSPFAVLDGANAVSRAIDADRVVVYCSAADETATERVKTATERYPDPETAFDVVTGPPVYRAAEPTMAIEAIEGNHRLEARLRPPGPDGVGIDRQPTVVHTARTVAHLAAALHRGEPSATRIVSVLGDVADPATVELPESAPLSDALDAVELDGEFKAACVGGQFGGLTTSLDARLDPESLSSAGLGTEGVVEVLSSDRCVVEFVGKRAQFAAETNCGRCVPCREGTTQLTELLRDIYDGEYDRDGIEELVTVMESSSICSFGVEAGRPTRTAIEAFESEFLAHADGRCPTGSCPQPMEAA